MEANGLMSCTAASAGQSGSGTSPTGIKVTLMRDPWPEIDVCVGGVDKGAALARFLRAPAVLTSLGAERIEPQTHLAVFGDAANDVPMFRAIDGARPALRVGMPHATHEELCALSNVRAEVSEVLTELCEAKAVAYSWAALRASGLPAAEALTWRVRAYMRAFLVTLSLGFVWSPAL